jgi:hypothetical protein
MPNAVPVQAFFESRAIKRSAGEANSMPLPSKTARPSPSPDWD